LTVPQTIYVRNSLPGSRTKPKVQHS